MASAAPLPPATSVPDLESSNNLSKTLSSFSKTLSLFKGMDHYTKIGIVIIFISAVYIAGELLRALTEIINPSGIGLFLIGCSSVLISVCIYLIVDNFLHG